MDEQGKKAMKKAITILITVIRLVRMGTINPEEIVLMPIPGSGSKEFLFCVKMYCEM